MEDDRLFMWEELTDSLQHCSNICTSRARCAHSTFQGISCKLYSNVERQKNIPLLRTHQNTPTGSWSRDDDSNTNTNVPTDCRTMGNSCDCRKGGMYRPIPFTREETCAKIGNSTILFTGDSLVRDVWTTLSLWLLVLDGHDVQKLANTENHAACFFQAWKMLRYMGVVNYLQKQRLLIMNMRKDLHVNYDGRLFRVCGGAFAFLSLLLLDMDIVYMLTTACFHFQFSRFFRHHKSSVLCRK